MRCAIDLLCQWPQGIELWNPKSTCCQCFAGLGWVPWGGSFFQCFTQAFRLNPTSSLLFGSGIVPFSSLIPEGLGLKGNFKAGSWWPYPRAECWVEENVWCWVVFYLCCPMRLVVSFLISFYLVVIMFCSLAFSSGLLSVLLAWCCFAQQTHLKSRQTSSIQRG